MRLSSLGLGCLKTHNPAEQKKAVFLLSLSARQEVRRKRAMAKCLQRLASATYTTYARFPDLVAQQSWFFRGETKGLWSEKNTTHKCTCGRLVRWVLNFDLGYSGASFVSVYCRGPGWKREYSLVDIRSIKNCALEFLLEILHIFLFLQMNVSEVRGWPDCRGYTELWWCLGYS